MLSPFIQYFLFKEDLHLSSVFGVIVILLSGVLVGVKKIYFDPNGSKQNELISIHEIHGSEDNDSEVDKNGQNPNENFTVDKVESFNGNSSESEIELEGKSQSQKIAWG